MLGTTLLGTVENEFMALDRWNFGKAFKRQMGRTPSRYRLSAVQPRRSLPQAAAGPAPDHIHAAPRPLTEDAARSGCYDSDRHNKREGIMRFILVGPTIEENLSVAYLASALRGAGHDAMVASFVRDVDHGAVAERVLALEPDVVGLSMTFQTRARGFLALARDLRRGGFEGHITAGGHFASVAAEELLTHAPELDSILVGEAEGSIVQLGEALAARADLAGVSGIVLRRDGRLERGPNNVKELDLDTLSWPVRDAKPPLLHLGLPSAPLVASRGCRGSCTFCSIRTFGRLSSGPARRLRSPGDVAAEMEVLWRTRGVRVFVFHDDDFFDGDPVTDLRRVRALRDAITSHRLPRIGLVVKARPDDIDDEVVGALREAGLVRAFLGVETDAPRGLKSLGRGWARDANRVALATLQKHDVFVCSNLLLWEPDTRLEHLHDNLALLADYADIPFNLARTELYEGAPLTLRLARERRLLGDYLGRDYRVADPRAELAWRIFRVVMGERCYPLQGVVNAAMGLGYDAHLLTHFWPSDEARRLASDALAVVRRVAESTRMWLAHIVAYAEQAPLGPVAEAVGYSAELARAVRTEDSRLLAEMGSVQAGLEAWAAAARQQEERARPSRAPSTRARVVTAAAAAGLVALLDAGSGCAKEPPAPPTPPDSPAVVLDVKPQGSHWQHCQGEAPKRVGAFALQAELKGAGLNARFERFEVTDGTVRKLYIAPNGRRARAVLAVGGRTGRQRLTAVFQTTGSDSRTLRRSAEFYEYGEGLATLGPERQPEPECYQVCDMAAPPPDTLLVESGDVVFVRSPYNATSGWASGFQFAVGLRQSVAGKLVGAPAVSCTVGTVSSRADSAPYVGQRADPEHPAAPPLNHRHALSFDPAPADGSGRLVGGDHKCTVRYQIEQGERTRTYEGTIPVRVEPDGNVRLGHAPVRRRSQHADAEPGVLPASPLDDYPELPLPERYSATIRPVAADAGSVLLELYSPAASILGEPALDWFVSAGEIVPMDGGWRARWILEDRAAEHVAVCSVRGAPLDLQVATWRFG